MMHLGITDWLIHDDSDMTYFGMTDLDIDDQLRPDALKHNDQLRQDKHRL